MPSQCRVEFAMRSRSTWWPRRYSRGPTGRKTQVAVLPEALEPAAVHVQRDAGDVARALGAEEGDGVGQLLGAPEAAERVLAGGQPARLVLGAGAELGGEAGGVPAPEAGVHPAGADGVDEDVVGAEFVRERLGQVEERAVGDAAAEHVGIGLLAGATDDVDDPAPAPGLHPGGDEPDRPHEPEQLDVELGPKPGV